MSLLQFNSNLKIRNTAHRQAFQLILVETVENLDNIKADAPEDKIFLNQQIVESQENACRLLHFVEGVDIDNYLAKPVEPRNDVMEDE